MRERAEAGLARRCAAPATETTFRRRPAGYCRACSNTAAQVGGAVGWRAVAASRSAGRTRGDRVRVARTRAYIGGLGAGWCG